MKNYVERILGHLEGNAAPSDLPADVRSTAFQRRVWQELKKIPRGETRSYKEIAEQLENAKSVRAVARAANPVAVITPCHRVVGSAVR